MALIFSLAGTGALEFPEGMTKRAMKAGVGAVALLGVTGVFPVSAQLPSLTDKDHLGYFVAADRRNFQFRIDSNGKAVVNVLDGKGQPLNKDYAIAVAFNVEETMPDGKTISRKFTAESLQSEQEATTKPKDLTIKGKVTGDIEFEATVTEDRGAIILGGRLLNPAGLKNPTRFSIEVDIPKAVPKPKKDEEKDEKKAAKEQKDRIKGDRVQLVWTDGKKARITSDQEVEGSSKEVSGPGITAASIEFAVFEDRKITLTAAPNSSMRLSNKAKQSLSEGFTLSWSADPAKDPNGKARLALEVK
jgi:hypothetical protein